MVCYIKTAVFTGQHRFVNHLSEVVPFGIVQNRTKLPEDFLIELALFKLAKKIICESCGTIFEYKITKDFEVRPVCKASFDDDAKENMELDEDTDELKEAVMYFNEIPLKYKERPEYNGAHAYCNECGKDNSLDLSMFDELVDKDHI